MNLTQLAHASGTHLTGGDTSNHDETNTLLIFMGVTIVAAIVLYLVARRLTGKDIGEIKPKARTAEEKAK
jgi:hypothetical protein